MSRFALVLLLMVAQNAFGQQAPVQEPAPRPTAEELAFARLPADVRGMLAGLTPAQAMQAVIQADQHLIALGISSPSPDQFRTALGALTNSSSYSVGSASAGATTFPPLSPLVAPPPPPLPQR